MTTVRLSITILRSRDHETVIEGLFSFVKGTRTVSTSYMKELHAELLRNQETTTAVDTLGRVVQVPLIWGDYKRQANNPTRPDGSIHQYCPPEQVPGEMERLIELHYSHSDVSTEVEAAWLHHRFTQIHPFQDGNGRVARCLATLIFLKAGWFPLVIRDTREERSRYVEAVEAADRGDLGHLVSVFAAAQKRAFVQALGISSQVLKLTRAEQIVVATRDLLAEREKARRAEWDRAKQIAQKLQAIAGRRFEEVTMVLSRETTQFFDNARFFVDKEPPGGRRDHYFRWQVVETAKQLEYYANTSEYRAWTRLVLKAGTQSEILLVAFHGAGREFRGIIAASASFYRREETEEGERIVADVTPLISEIFQVNYRDPEEEAETRFRDWAEDVLVRGLELWRAGL